MILFIIGIGKAHMVCGPTKVRSSVALPPAQSGVLKNLM